MRTVDAAVSLWATVRSLWFRRQTRRYLIQFLFLAAVLSVLASAVSNVHGNLVRQGMTYGWDFLWRATGWKLSTSIFDQGITDPYWWTILMGIVNTLIPGVICILLATVIGCIVGLLRLSGNAALRAASSFYVNLLRNIPVIMQLYFWYELSKRLPAERRAMSFGDTFFLSNRGFYFPSIEVASGHGLFILGLAGAILIAVVAAVRRRSFLMVPITLIGVVLYVALLGSPLEAQVPALRGFGFSGGKRFPIELVVLIVAISIYSSAYVAEIVRGGLLAVDQGQIEAGRALGLKASTIHWRIRLPLAMRSALPPLGNQYLITMKVTSLGAAIGYADLFSVTSTSINHAGQTIELLGIMIGAYLVINYLIARIMQYLNDRFALRGVHRTPDVKPSFNLMGMWKARVAKTERAA